MVLNIIKYGDPVLRKKGARIDRVNAEVRRLMDDMLETMRAHKGVGLAAQQVGVALQLTVIDVREVTDRPSSLEWKGKPVEVAEHMPLVLINPEIKPTSEAVSGPEGCLSFPELYAEIARPETVDVKALDRNGKIIEFRCGGLLARAVQHETDHLHGILFIDRMDRKTKDELRPDLERLQAETKAQLASARTA
jgi:peptide deformylase